MARCMGGNDVPLSALASHFAERRGESGRNAREFLARLLDTFPCPAFSILESTLGDQELDQAFDLPGLVPGFVYATTLMTTAFLECLSASCKASR